MATTELHELVGNVLLGAPGVPEPVAVRAYLDAARDFLTQTRAWTVMGLTLASASSPGQNLWALNITPPTDTEVFDALRVWDVERRLEKGVVDVGRGTANQAAVFQAGINKLFFDGEIADAAQVSGLFALRPLRNAEEIDDDVTAHWAEVFEYGAYARVLTVPGQPWSAPETGLYYGRLFAAEVNEWRSKAVDRGQVGVVREVAYGGL